MMVTTFQSDEGDGVKQHTKHDAQCLVCTRYSANCDCDYFSEWTGDVAGAFHTALENVGGSHLPPASQTGLNYLLSFLLVSIGKNF